MGQGAERPVFGASESQDGEWAFERSRNSEAGVLGELSEYSFEKGKRSSHTNGEQTLVKGLLNSLMTTSRMTKVVLGKIQTEDIPMTERMPESDSEGSYQIKGHPLGNEATTFGIIFYPARQKQMAVYQFSVSYPLSLLSLSHSVVFVQLQSRV